jgi:hypothetical protein
MAHALPFERQQCVRIMRMKMRTHHLTLQKKADPHASSGEESAWTSPALAPQRGWAFT